MGIGLDLQEAAQREELLKQMENKMNQVQAKDFTVVTVNKEELLTTVRKNRVKHEQEYNEAVKVWRTETIETMRQNLKKAEEGGEIETYIATAIPVNYLKDYDKIIKKLEMHQDGIIYLSDREFQCFVMDEWEWSHNFASNTRAYSVKALSK